MQIGKGRLIVKETSSTTCRELVYDPAMIEAEVRSGQVRGTTLQLLVSYVVGAGRVEVEVEVPVATWEQTDATSRGSRPARIDGVATALRKRFGTVMDASELVAGVTAAAASVLVAVLAAAVAVALAVESARPSELIASDDAEAKMPATVSDSAGTVTSAGGTSVREGSIFSGNTATTASTRPVSSELRLAILAAPPHATTVVVGRVVVVVVTGGT
jgi:hypothetical protein